MFVTLKNKFKDVGTLSVLCKEAERIARIDGKQAPGSEHFVLASLALPDATARAALVRLGASPESFAEAIRIQFEDALRHVGLTAGADAGWESASSPPAPDAAKLFRAAPSGQSMLQRIAATSGVRQGRELLAADVLLAAAEEELSIAARALRVLDISQQQLIQAADGEIARYLQHRGAA